MRKYSFGNGVVATSAFNFGQIGIVSITPLKIKSKVGAEVSAATLNNKDKIFLTFESVAAINRQIRLLIDLRKDMIRGKIVLEGFYSEE
jgi:hypothetical protein